MENYLVYLRQLNIESMMLRVALAMLAGGIVGFEREKKGQSAGFRTYMLVSLGAAVTMIVSQYLDYMLLHGWSDAYKINGNRTDIVRLGAQVINGIGFLGTGTILVTSRSEVKGLTTASGLWASACMGLAAGAGFYECTIVGFVLILLCINVLPAIEKAVLPRAKNMNIYLEMDSIQNIGEVVNTIKAQGIALYDVEINRNKAEGEKNLSALLSLHLPKRGDHNEILALLSTLEGIITIDEV